MRNIFFVVIAYYNTFSLTFVNALVCPGRCNLNAQGVQQNLLEKNRTVGQICHV